MMGGMGGRSLRAAVVTGCTAPRVYSFCACALLSTGEGAQGSSHCRRHHHCCYTATTTATTSTSTVITLPPVYPRANPQRSLSLCHVAESMSPAHVSKLKYRLSIPMIILSHSSFWNLPQQQLNTQIMFTK